MLGILAALRRNPWRSLRAHLPHVHQWEKLGRLVEPTRDVYDCACGMRQVVTVGGPGSPESTCVITQGSSLDNVLINVSLLRS